MPKKFIVRHCVYKNCCLGCIDKISHKARYATIGTQKKSKKIKTTKINWEMLKLLEESLK